MAAVRAAVNLTLGLVSCTVAVHAAIQAKTANVIVCTGRGGEPHDATRIFETKNCPTCGVVHSDVLDKARPTPEGLVLLEAEDVAEIQADAAEYKDRMAMTPHPAQAVELGTGPGSKAYHLVPNRGHAETYAALVALLHEHPELAFMAKWTPRSNVAVVRITSDGTSLFARERVAGDQLKAVPDILPASNTAVVEQLVSMAETVLTLPGIVQDFDLASYRDESEDKIAALVAQRVAVPDAKRGAGSAAPAGPDAALEALAAMIADAQPAPKAKKTATRKPAAKRGGS